MARREAVSKGEQYVVSDENGYDIGFYDNLLEAEERADEGCAELEERDEEGSYVVGERVDENGTAGPFHYEF